MRFEKPLNQGSFQKRYKRFFTDIEFEGETITAHCPNTGSMMGLKEPGSPCLFSTSDDPKRKLKHTLQMIKTPKSWVGVNTALPNKLAVELFEKNPLPHWRKFDLIQSEVKINDHSRIDMVLWDSKVHLDVDKWGHKNLKPPIHLIEIKNVTLAEAGVAFFPDAVTTRGQKHLDELMGLVQKGFTCEMLFVIQRTDCQEFRGAKDIDPVYVEKLYQARDAGVKITPLGCSLDQNGVNLVPRELPFL